MIILRQGKIGNIVDVQVIADGLVELNTVTAERTDLRQLSGDVAVNPDAGRRLNRHDLVAIERWRDLISEEISAATLGGDAEAEARDAVLDDLRLGIKLAPRTNVPRLLHHEDRVRHSKDETCDVYSLARVRALIFGLHVRTRERAGPVRRCHCAFRWNMAPI